MALDDIEHRILRPIWRDNRIHYAVNCASIGCPNLQPLAYRAYNLEEFLERGARDYVRHPRGVHIERGVMTLSSIGLPGLNGFEVLEVLRERYPPDELPVIMATAKDQNADVIYGGL